MKSASIVIATREGEAYWRHELVAFDRAYDELIAAPEPPTENPK